jgi:hypothetical protein
VRMDRPWPGGDHPMRTTGATGRSGIDLHE